MKTSAVSTALASLAIALAASACGSSEPTANALSPAASPATVTSATTTVECPSQPIDELITIGSGRMHLRCVGAGPTTVLLIAGWGDGGDNWGAVEPEISERTRVCSYARFGTGASDGQTSTQTFATQVADLHALLDQAAEPGPYVVLGHSFGGAEAVTFAASFPDEVTGLMLLDASPTTWPATACSVAAWEALCAVMRDPTLDPERLDVFPAFDEVATITSLGDLPMTVMTAAHRTAPELTQAELTRLDTVWAQGVERWAGLSSSSSVVSVEDTGHHIEVDQPQLVIEELLELLR